MLKLQEILVPLDGSGEAESVLPYLGDLAPRFGSHVHILGVGIGRKTRRVNRLLEDYINRIANSLHSDNIKAESVIRYGARERASHVAEQLRLEQSLAQGRAIHCDERFVRFG